LLDAHVAAARNENMEKTGLVDQKVAARFGRVRELVLAEGERFAVQGSVVAGSSD
jgi:hypothetical protein